jgi:hypothetical protein
MGIRVDGRGQGSAEYILLFGAIIFVAIAGLVIYYSYFQQTTGNGTVDAKMKIQNLNTKDNTAITYALYKISDGGTPVRKAYANPTIPKSQTKEHSLGKLDRNNNYVLDISVRSKGGSVLVTLIIDDKETTSMTVSYPSTGSVSFSVPGKEGSSVSFSQDAHTVRTEISY